MRIVSDKRCREKSKTHISCKFFKKKSCRENLEKMWKNMADLGRPQATNTARKHCMLGDVGLQIHTQNM